jgi:uncharacterized protein YndB with AHSA1/START domain
MKQRGMMRNVRSTRVSRHVKTAPATVYAALLDAEAIARWKVPAGMTCQVHTFEGREGGAFRISLTYDASTKVGKTTARTDTCHGRFLELVANERVVEVDEFETADPALQGEMKITITLVDADGGRGVRLCQWRNRVAASGEGKAEAPFAVGDHNPVCAGDWRAVRLGSRQREAGVGERRPPFALLADALWARAAVADLRDPG